MTNLALETELIETYEALALCRRLEKQLYHVEAVLASEKAGYAALGGQVSLPPVENGSGEPGFSRMFAQVFGRKIERIDLRRQEQLAHRLKLANIRTRIAILERARNELSARRAGMVGFDRRLHELLAQMETPAEEPDGPSRRVGELSSRLADARTRRRDLRDAQRAGEQAQARLARAKDALLKANRPGSGELFSGGGMKWADLDAAYSAIQDAQVFLMNFECEMVGCNLEARLRTGPIGLAVFADIAVDGLLVDLLAQCEFSEAADAISAVSRRVNDLLDGIRARLEDAGQAEQRIASERSEMTGHQAQFEPFY